MNVTGLSVGPHLVGVRYKDNNNTWGEVLYQTIHVYDANPSGSGSGGSGGGGSGGASGGFTSISAAEYFVDTDPGAGSGIAFQAKDGAFDSEVESILPKDLNVTGLSVGPHLVGVRYKDNNNTWGEVLYQTIHVYDANPDINNGGSGGSGGTGGFTVIAGAEYFIGNDPGEGNATALQPKDGAFDSEVESTLTASLSLNGYALGTYLVGVRYKDNNGTWGDVLFKTIEVDVDTDGDGLADKAETFTKPMQRFRTRMGTGISTGRKSPLAVIPRMRIPWVTGHPPVCLPRTPFRFWKTCRPVNFLPSSMPRMGKATAPSLTPSRMGLDRAETPSSLSMQMAHFGQPRYSIMRLIPRTRYGFGSAISTITSSIKTLPFRYRTWMKVRPPLSAMGRKKTPTR